ncbi:iron complex transport system ATP-binding protein [Nonomuraea solani]|uniref:Iron complex transport system ATP-binding protein n=1 Tax=Nonomuraea solani TaxID=1144553 RepID=A0A1H6BSG0_9ACTN|nr:heme ABC transporter ATP-binding protein [Nonomuraea solani]SEG63639.1 iron complex transport system ATP-binding protein [Nonomuraea solani]
MTPERPAAGAVYAESRGVRFGYGRAEVLRGVDLSIVAGEVLALVGPNGSGKSTLLSVLAGDERPASGAVHLDGRPLAEWTAREQALRRAVLPQQLTLSFPFTVEEVVTMGRAPWERTPQERYDEEIVEAELERTSTRDFRTRSFQELSGGERARVSLARVLAQRAPMVLLDEPTAALDIRHQEAVLGIARERAAAGDALVVVLHDLALAAAYADRVAVLSEGVVAACGPPGEVFTEELLSRVYQHAIEVLPHPRTGVPLVVARR